MKEKTMIPEIEPKPLNPWEALKPFVKTGEEFTLRSGRKSDMYIDAKGALLSLGAPQILSAIQELILSYPHQGNHFHYFGYGYGGALLCAGMVGAAYLSCEATVFRGEKKEHGLGSEPIGNLPRPIKKEIVILEDVVTTESSVKECLELMSHYNHRATIRIVSVVDRRADKDKTLSICSLFTEESIRAAL